VQEIYGLLIAHYVVPAVMVEAAEKAALPPSRLSFTNTLRLIREMIPEAQRTAPRPTMLDYTEDYWRT
jgi:hypothetical protein